MSGPGGPPSADCLDIRAVLNLIDHPEQADDQELKHLAACQRCQRAVALARRHRALLEAPWGKAADARRWVGRAVAVLGVAALVVIAVGVNWWLLREPELFGQMRGRFEVLGVTRAEEPPERKYTVTVELTADAYVTFLYLDHTRKLQLPQDASRHAVRLGAGPRPFSVTVTHDPPGPQWIAAVASESAFDPFTLRDELQASIEPLSEQAPFDNILQRLEQELRERRGLRFRGHRFEVPPPDVP
jgi:hypothetical protein